MQNNPDTTQTEKTYAVRLDSITALAKAFHHLTTITNSFLSHGEILTKGIFVHCSRSL